METSTNPVFVLSASQRQRLERAAEQVIRSAQSSDASTGLNWRRLATATISDHYHAEYPGLTNQQIAMRETMDEVERKITQRELDLARTDNADLQETVEDILNDILDFMVHDAQASSDESGGSDDSDSDSRSPVNGGNRHSGSSLDDSDTKSNGLAEDSDIDDQSGNSDSDSESGIHTRRRGGNEVAHRHEPTHERRHEAEDVSPSSSYEAYGAVHAARQTSEAGRTRNGIGRAQEIGESIRANSSGASRDPPPPESSIGHPQGHGSGDDLLVRRQDEEPGSNEHLPASSSNPETPGSAGEALPAPARLKVAKTDVNCCSTM